MVLATTTFFFLSFFFMKSPEPTNYCKLRTLSSSLRSEKSLLSQPGSRSVRHSVSRLQSPRRRENFLRLKQEERERESQLAEEANVASCGSEQSHQMTGCKHRDKMQHFWGFLLHGGSVCLTFFVCWF